MQPLARQLSHDAIAFLQRRCLLLHTPYYYYVLDPVDGFVMGNGFNQLKARMKRVQNSELMEIPNV